ncbi:MAG: hypothetical protein D6744_13050 [Planctomycetota bacterium]|nr:MAG: hypothetical protein D6744_13050 [Planctomycetota bacterium]
MAATCRPGWYQPAVVDYARLDSDNRALVNLLDRIGVELNGGRALELRLEQDQINRWIAARDEWPEAVGRVDLGDLRSPQVLLLSGNRARLAAMVERGGFGVVLSCDVRFELDGEKLLIYWEQFRAGLLPAPRALIEEALSRSARSSALRAAAESGRLSLPNRWVWPNGKPEFVFRAIEISDGTARIELTPTGSRGAP